MFIIVDAYTQHWSYLSSSRWNFPASDGVIGYRARMSDALRSCSGFQVRRQITHLNSYVKRSTLNAMHGDVLESGMNHLAPPTRTGIRREERGASRAFCSRTARTSLSSPSSHPERWTVSSVRGLGQLQGAGSPSERESPATWKLVPHETSPGDVPEATRPARSLTRRNSLLDFDYQENPIPNPDPGPDPGILGIPAARNVCDVPRRHSPPGKVTENPACWRARGSVRSQTVISL